MDLIIIFFWFIAFIVILLVLTAINYFLGRSTVILNIDEKSSDSILNQISQRSNTNQNKRKNARKKQRRQQASLNNDSQSKIHENQSIVLEKSSGNDEFNLKSSTNETKPTDNEDTDEFQEPGVYEDSSTTKSSSNDSISFSSAAHVEVEQMPTIQIKQRNKPKSQSTTRKFSNGTTKTFTLESSDAKKNGGGGGAPSKPQASIAPLKQVDLFHEKTVSTKTNQSNSTRNFPSNDVDSSSTCSSIDIPSKSSKMNFTQKFREKDSIDSVDQFSERKSIRTSENSSISMNRSEQTNDFLTTQTKQRAIGEHRFSQNNPLPFHHNSSESVHPVEHRPSVPLSSETKNSVKNVQSIRYLSHPNTSLDQLLSVFDTNSFSTDELELLLSRAMNKQILQKQDPPSVISTTKNDQIIERLIDENNRNQVKILVMELQAEKTRVFELTKSNTEMEQIIRHWQQQQQPTEAQIQYQQTIASCQMELKRLSDEHLQLMHQLHIYSAMPGTINELKQQEQLLNDELRQTSQRNSTLEQEISDGERAGKHAAEIYRKADAQKQERIEQMVVDLAKYRKIDKDLLSIRQEYENSEKKFQSKLDQIIEQRDELKKACQKSKKQLEGYEEFKIQYEQLKEKRISEGNLSKSIEDLQQELDEARTKHDLLRQRNCKIVEQCNKLTQEQKSHQKNQQS